MGKIQNFSNLATTPLRRFGLELADVALQSIDTATVLRERICFQDGILQIDQRQIPLHSKKNVFVVCIGKCAAQGGEALEAILGSRLNGGFVLDIQPVHTKTLRALQGTHPLASEANISATKEILSFLAEAGQEDFILFLISGGGSALLACPEQMDIETENRIVSHLTNKGASIQQINIVRKHLSKARGGFLASSAFPAESFALYFSDVPQDDLAWVASGPTVFDPTTPEEAKGILEEFHLSPRGLNLINTPTDQKLFARVTNLCFLNNRTPLNAMAEYARKQGYQVFIRSDVIEENAEHMARHLCRELKHCSAKTVLLYGGETTVPVRGTGHGGRNLHLALTALPILEPGQCIISLATDGQDHGPWAGAIADWELRLQADLLGIDSEEYRLNCDAYSFFAKLPTYLETGPTHSNVADLLIAVKE